MKPKLMTRVRRPLLAAALAIPAAIALQATSASAAETGAAATGAAAEPNTPASGPMMARVEQRIATLHAQLQITAAEEPQWQEFAKVMRANAQKMEENASKRAAKFQSLSAVENMKSYADMAVEHGQNVQRLAAAFEIVYNLMSPNQKKLADTVFRERAEQRQQRHRS